MGKSSTSVHLLAWGGSPEGNRGYLPSLHHTPDMRSLVLTVGTQDIACDKLLMSMF